MTPGLRKLALTGHVTSSVAWLGAVAAFLVLAIVGVASRDPLRVQAAYVAMELTGWDIIVPLALASLLTGLIQALGTEWGLLQHYWVLLKLVMTVVATALLLVHMQPTSQMARAAHLSLLEFGELRSTRIQLLADAAAASVVLLAATALSIYKPRGKTQYARRVQRG